ncbi:hypothetical protein [uncultured Roseobacter sp.]|uniref:hypothetical protein n=1 Tax=uncultured Roseobacter sp. TaxID=114847 RepID=UPI0026274EE4|nr:hypothetical protein [uncultured Roseobacter sp.]
MTCGACTPEAFREGGGVVYGYLVARTVDQAASEARKLYFMGAQHVFADEPTGHIQHRSSYSKLSNRFLRPGDKLILATETALGTKRHQAERHIEALMARGVEVFTLNPEYFEYDEP